MLTCRWLVCIGVYCVIDNALVTSYITISNPRYPFLRYTHVLMIESVRQESETWVTKARNETGRLYGPQIIAVELRNSGSPSKIGEMDRK